MAGVVLGGLVRLHIGVGAVDRGKRVPNLIGREGAAPAHGDVQGVIAQGIRHREQAAVRRDKARAVHAGVPGDVEGDEAVA